MTSPMPMTRLLAFLKRRLMALTDTKSVAPARGCALLFSLIGFASVVTSVSMAGAEEIGREAFRPPVGTIGLVLSSWSDALVETPKAEECSLGLQKGDIAQFKAMDGYLEHLQTFGGDYELRGPHGETPAFSPMSVEDPIPFSELTTKVGYGANLDGTADGRATPKTCQHNKFTNPDGEKVDNQMARVVGCVLGYRTGGLMHEGHNGEMVTSSINRHLIEISGVTDERNDSSVDVAIYKGIDRLVRNGTSFIPFQSHRIDQRYPNFELKTHGKIVDGVLITDPIPEAMLPLAHMGLIGTREMRDVVLRLKLNDTGAEGLITGYESTTRWWHSNRSQISSGPGQYSLAGMYRALHRYADGYPDPTTGQCTFISAAYNVTAVRAIIVHPVGDHARAQVASAQRR